MEGQVPQATDPKGPGCQPLLAEAGQQGLHQLQITGLEQGPVQHHAHPSARLLAPVVGQGVGLGNGDGGGNPVAGQQVVQAPQHRSHVAGAALPQAVADGQGQLGIGRAEAGQGFGLVLGAGHHEQLTPRPGCPGPQLLQAVAPVAPAPQEPHQHDLGLRQAGADVMVDHRRMGQGLEVQAPHGTGEELGLVRQQGGQARQIAISAAEQHDGGAGLLHENGPLLGAGAARNRR